MGKRSKFGRGTKGGNSKRHRPGVATFPPPPRRGGVAPPGIPVAPSLATSNSANGIEREGVGYSVLGGMADHNESEGQAERPEGGDATSNSANGIEREGVGYSVLGGMADHNESEGQAERPEGRDAPGRKLSQGGGELVEEPDVPVSPSPSVSDLTDGIEREGGTDPGQEGDHATLSSLKSELRDALSTIKAQSKEINTLKKKAADFSKHLQKEQKVRAAKEKKMLLRIADLEKMNAKIKLQLVARSDRFTSSIQNSKDSHRAEKLKLTEEISNLKSEVKKLKAESKEIKASTKEKVAEAIAERREMERDKRRTYQVAAARAQQKREVSHLRQVKKKDTTISSIKSSHFKEIRKLRKSETNLREKVDIANRKNELFCSEMDYNKSVLAIEARKQHETSIAKLSSQVSVLRKENMDASERAINAEREVRNLHIAIEKKEEHCLPHDYPLSRPVHDDGKLTDESQLDLFESLLKRIIVKAPSSAMQKFAASVIAKMVDKSGMGSLETKRGTPLLFRIVGSMRALKESKDCKERTIAHRHWAFARKLSKEIDMFGPREAAQSVLGFLGKRYGFSVFANSELEFSGEQCVAMRDHAVDGNTRAFDRFRQGFETFLPELGKKVFPRRMRQKISVIEKRGVIRSAIYGVPDCLITKKGNKRAMCNFWFSLRPCALFANMVKLCYMEGQLVDSQKFSSLQNMIVMSVGFDKSDSDFVGTWRVCNRKDGNSSIYVQCFACLEGPVAEVYENEKRTVFNPSFPIKATVDAMYNDQLYSLIVSTDNRKSCQCMVFRAIPTVDAVTERPIDVTVGTIILSESLVEWKEESFRMAGHPPDVHVGLDEDDVWRVHISLVSSTESSSEIVGIRFYSSMNAMTALRFEEAFEMGSSTVDDITVLLRQISGHVSNDGKQTNILSGQCSCSVGYPMPCCMVSKHDLGTPPEWLSRMFLLRVVAGALDQSQRCEELTDEVADLFGAFAGMPVVGDAQRREGQFSFENTHELWKSRTHSGRKRMSKADHQRDNKDTGSSFNPPLSRVPCVKNTLGFMHTGNGHINHFWIEVGLAIRARMKGCRWQIRLEEIVSEVKRELKRVAAEIKVLEQDQEIKRKKSELRKIAKKIKNENDSERRAELEQEENQLRDELGVLLSRGMLGDLNLVLGGLKEFESVLEGLKSKESKRPGSDLEYVLWKAIETRAGGRLDAKSSGYDQTNSAGLTSLENSYAVFEALLGMYPAQDPVHVWLRKEVEKWKRLAWAIYDIGCFLKSQKKRSPTILDKKLLRLWCRWEDAFPGKSFNKYHGVFCAVHRFVHKFEMAGVVSEESNEAFNARLAEIKRVVRTMPSHKQRVEKINERTQGNLKGEVMESAIAIKKNIKGDKRGTYAARPQGYDGRAILPGHSAVRMIDGERFVMLWSGKLLNKKFMDIYEWGSGGKAPKDWVDGLNKTAPGTFSEIDRIRERNSKLI